MKATIVTNIFTGIIVALICSLTSFSFVIASVENGSIWPFVGLSVAGGLIIGLIVGLIGKMIIKKKTKE